MKKRLTVQEKALKVMEAMENKAYSSVEKACEVYKISPASYYIYAKKARSAGIKSTKEIPKVPTSAQNWVSEVQELRAEVAFLKKEMEFKDSFIKNLLMKYALTESKA